MKFDYEIQFDRDYYHLLESMQSWCRENVGDGGYLPREGCNWSIETMFGNSTFRFKEERHRNWFALRWQ